MHFMYFYALIFANPSQMIQAKLIHDTRRITKKGYPVKIYISGNNQKKYVSTGIYCTVKEWKKPDRLLAARLKRLSHHLQQAADACNRDHITFNQAAARFIPQSSLLLDVIDRFIDQYKGAGKSVRNFKDMRSEIQKYRPGSSINEITYEWLSGFVAHKRKGGTGNAGIGYYMRSLRTVYLEAQRRESFSLKPGNPFQGVIPQSVTKKPVALSKSDLSKFANYKPLRASKSVDRRIAVFLFQIYIGGHDFIDVARLRWEDMRDGRIRFYRHKMRNRGGELVDNILVPQALEILENYGSKGDRVFPWIPADELKYIRYRSNTNRTLSDISERLNLPKIRTKSPRYIFRSWAGEAGADIIATMQIQGHKAQGVTFGYQSRLPDRIVDRVLEQVLRIE